MSGRKAQWGSERQLCVHAMLGGCCCSHMFCAAFLKAPIPPKNKTLAWKVCLFLASRTVPCSEPQMLVRLTPERITLGGAAFALLRGCSSPRSPARAEEAVVSKPAALLTATPPKQGPPGSPTAPGTMDKLGKPLARWTNKLLVEPPSFSSSSQISPGSKCVQSNLLLFSR